MLLPSCLPHIPSFIYPSLFLHPSLLFMLLHTTPSSPSAFSLFIHPHPSIHPTFFPSFHILPLSGPSSFLPSEVVLEKHSDLAFLPALRAAENECSQSKGTVPATCVSALQGNMFHHQGDSYQGNVFHLFTQSISSTVFFFFFF